MFEAIILTTKDTKHTKASTRRPPNASARFARKQLLGALGDLGGSIKIRGSAFASPIRWTGPGAA
jgi:hypothetical protein